MHEDAAPLARAFVVVDDSAREEFEARLAESTTLAFRVAYGVLRQREAAEDVAQDALVRAYRSLHQLRDRERFKAWLVRTAWRLALDQQRATRRRQARDHAGADPTGGITQPVVDTPAEQLWRAIDRLPERLRHPLVLASIEGHGLRDVAAVLDIPEGTVKSRLFEARRVLKEYLQ